MRFVDNFFIKFYSFIFVSQYTLTCMLLRRFRIFAQDVAKSSYSCGIMVRKYLPAKEQAGAEMVLHIKNGQMLQANGIDMLIFEHDNGYISFQYKDHDTEYDILLESTGLKTALDFVKTIA